MPSVALIIAGLMSTWLAERAHAAPVREPDVFHECRAQLAATPEEYDSAYCFYAVVARAGLWATGVDVFERLVDAHPGNRWLPLAFGHLYRNRPRPDFEAAESWYRRAADGFRSAGQAEGEIVARSNLRDILMPRGRVAAASAEVARVSALADTESAPIVRARAWTVEATHLFDTGGDHGRAFHLLRQAEHLVFPNGPYRLQRTILTASGRVALRMGRLDEAASRFRRLEGLARAWNDPQTGASAQYNVLNVDALRESLLPTRDGTERLLRAARVTLAAGQAAGHASVSLKAHRIIAALLLGVPEGRQEALGHVERCLTLATLVRQPEDEAACAWLAALLWHGVSVERARAAQARALRATSQANSPMASALTVGRQMEFSWLTKPRSEAIRDSLAALDALETLRSLQEGPDSAAEVFSTWTLDYYWLAGRLLQDEAPDLDVAFSVAERLRGRVLLESRQRSRAAADSDHPAIAERRLILQDISTVQRALMDPALEGTPRRQQLEQLALLESREREVARQIAVVSLAGAREGAELARLDQVQSALGPQEALLSFHLGIWSTIEKRFGGGGWLIAATRDRRFARRIPDRVHFAPLVPVFTGLLTRGDGLEVEAATRLHAEVFAGVLDSLPPSVNRLILVPDGPLQALAFDALRASAHATPLAERFELVVTPSATLWLASRRRSLDRARTPQKALALVDPELPQATAADAEERQAVLARGLALGRLPYARREGQALARHLRAVDRLMGREASERVFKTRDLSDYGLLHLAAHAVTDDIHPERSAVLLASGGGSDDGLLQPREIAELDLDHMVVVLSACQTASGAVLGGEGVLSLARAFFQAGALAVIGTRWPVRDRDAAWLFEAFYERLEDGVSISDALARTKAAAIRAGKPPSVWASLVLYGDTTQLDVPRRSPLERVLSGAFVLAISGLVVVAVEIDRRRRRRSPIL